MSIVFMNMYKRSKVINCSLDPLQRCNIVTFGVSPIVVWDYCVTNCVTSVTFYLATIFVLNLIMISGYGGIAGTVTV